MKPEEPDSGLLLAATGLVEGLVVALLHCKTHRPEHPKVEETLAKIGRFLKKLTRQGAIELVVQGGCIHWGARALTGASLSASRLLEQLGARGAGGLCFEPTAGPADLLALVSELAVDPPAGDSFPAASARLAAAGCEQVRLLQDSCKTPGASEHGLPSQPGALGVHQALSKVLQEALIRVDRGQEIAMGPAVAAIHAAIEILEESPANLFELAGYERFDPLGIGHSVRVALLALGALRSTGIERGLLCRIGMAALFHDIGMTRVPSEIVSSREPLTEDQRRTLETHPVSGAAFLATAEGADPLAVAVAFGHHRGADGVSGYPQVRANTSPCAAARLVRICDIYEALTSPRPYKVQMPAPRACRTLMEMGAELDQALLRRFIAGIGFYPPGLKVGLSDGARGRVIRPNADPARPVVAIERAGVEHVLDLSRSGETARIACLA